MKKSGKKQAPGWEAVAPRVVYMGVTDFLRWASKEGVTISRKNFYKTYFAAGARYPVRRSKDGRRVDRQHAIEMIRAVQGDAGAGGTVLERRQDAEARYKAARARQAEIDVELAAGLRVPIEAVKKAWGRAIGNLKAECRTRNKNLPEELVGKSKEEMQQILERSDEEVFRHVSGELVYGSAD